MSKGIGRRFWWTAKWSWRKRGTEKVGEKYKYELHVWLEIHAGDISFNTLYCRYVCVLYGGQWDCTVGKWVSPIWRLGMCVFLKGCIQQKSRWTRPLVMSLSDGSFATESVWRNDSLTRTNRLDSTFQFSLVRLYSSFSQTRLPLTDSLFTKKKYSNKRQTSVVLFWQWLVY